jgi:hypothetical protein
MFRSTVKFTIGGREVSQSQFGDAFKDTVRDAAKEALRSRVESVACPVHGQKAQVSSIDPSASGWNYSIHGCCDALTEAVRKMLSQN